MIKARQAGYRVNEKILENAASYLRHYAVRYSSLRNLPYSTYGHLVSRAYIAYALALYGKPDNTLINSLYGSVDQVPFFGQAHLLKAMALAKYDAAHINRIKAMLYNNVKIASTTAHYENPKFEDAPWFHASTTRATAAVLQAFMEIKDKNPLNDKAVNRLVLTHQKKRSRYENTQDNVWAFWAMTDYYRFYEKVKPDFTATLRAAGKTLLSRKFRGRTQPALVSDFKFKDFDRGKEMAFSFTKKGPGRLYYGLRLRYAPREMLKSRDEGFMVLKHYETLKGDKISGAQFQSGQDYVVVVTVETRQKRHFVMVDDPVPAGLKIVNLSFQTTARHKYQGVKRQSRWWGSFSHHEQYADRVLLFADSMTPGKHTYRYLVRAVTPGDYLLPPTKAEEMYTPDVFGYFGQQRAAVR